MFKKESRKVLVIIALTICAVSHLNLDKHVNFMFVGYASKKVSV